MKLRQAVAFAALLGAALSVAFLFTRTAFADEPIVGTWKLVSLVVTDLETKEHKQVWGQHPGGLAIYSPDKRILSLWTAEGRTGGQGEADRARNFMSMFAVAGKYRVEGSKYFVTVEVSWNPAMVGTEQTRDFKIEGNRLTLTTAPAPSPQIGNHMAQVTAVYERAAQ